MAGPRDLFTRDWARYHTGLLLTPYHTGMPPLHNVIAIIAPVSINALRQLDKLCFGKTNGILISKILVHLKLFLLESMKLINEIENFYTNF